MSTIIRKMRTDVDTEQHHVHYDHQDDCKEFRWTARESYEYLYDRPWEDVTDFYSHLGAGRLSLSDLVFHGSKKGNIAIPSGNAAVPSCTGILLENNSKKARGGKWARRTFKVLLSYDGNQFDGWQKQPGLNTVQGLVEKSLGKFVDEKKAQELEAKKASVEAAVSVAGRTDKGVSAFQQVCSFYTWRKDTCLQDIESEINAAALGKLRVVSISEVSREFHPNFSAKWRRYLYILPLKDGEGYKPAADGESPVSYDGLCLAEKGDNQSTDMNVINMESVNFSAIGEHQALVKPRNFNVDTVNQLLQQLEGQSLSYRIFARDTQASRSRGPATECFMYHARAAVATLPYLGQDTTSKGRTVMCVELVANRFLRKMVRVLVATAVREAAAGATPDSLLKLMHATCRRASAPPAPPQGLCLVDIGYTDMNQENFLI